MEMAKHRVVSYCDSFVLEYFQREAVRVRSLVAAQKLLARGGHVEALIKRIGLPPSPILSIEAPILREFRVWESRRGEGAAVSVELLAGRWVMGVGLRGSSAKRVLGIEEKSGGKRV